MLVLGFRLGSGLGFRLGFSVGVVVKARVRGLFSVRVRASTGFL